MKRKELLLSVVGLGRGGGGSIQTAEMNWKVLHDSFPESLSSLLSANANAMVYVAKLHSLM